MSESDYFLVTLGAKLKSQTNIGRTILGSCQELLSYLSDETNKLLQEFETYFEGVKAEKAGQSIEIARLKTETEKSVRIINSLKHKLQEYHSFSHMLKKVTALNIHDDEPLDLDADGSTLANTDLEGPQPEPPNANPHINIGVSTGPAQPEAR